MNIQLKRILLVDDSPRDTEMTLDALAQNNLANEVISLRDGVEALDYLYRRGEFAGRAGGNPAVVLLDLKMPRVDGTEVLRQIKSDPQLKTIPVVVMTSSSEESDVSRSYQLGVNALHRQTGPVPGIHRGGQTAGRVLGGSQPAAAGQCAAGAWVRRGDGHEHSSANSLS